MGKGSGLLGTQQVNAPATVATVQLTAADQEPEQEKFQMMQRHGEEHKQATSIAAKCEKEPPVTPVAKTSPRDDLTTPAPAVVKSHQPQGVPMIDVSQESLTQAVPLLKEERNETNKNTSATKRSSTQSVLAMSGL